MGVRFDWPVDEGFAQLVAAHAQPLLRLAILLTGNRYDAEDALQDAVIAVAAKWHRLRPATAAGYLRTTVARRAVDFGRQRSRIAADEVPEYFKLDPGYLRFEGDAEFVRLLQGLPEKQRAVLVLRYYGDYDDAAIGRMLGCTTPTVRSQASRALAKLRERMTAPVVGAAGGGPDGSD